MPHHERIGVNSRNRNERETCNLPDTVFKTLLISMLKELYENFNKDIISLK